MMMKQKLTHNEKNILHLKNKDFNGLYATNKRYIEKLANNFCIGDAEVLKDLIQVGAIGLFKAFESYNNERVPFISYASFWIKKEMVDFLNKNLRTIRIPAHQLNPKHAMHNPDHPTYIPTVSTATPLNDDDGNMIIEDLLASDISEEKPDYNELYYYFNKLSEKQQEALKLRFGFDSEENEKLTYREVGIILNETGQNVKLKVDKALSILKKKIIKK